MDTERYSNAVVPELRTPDNSSNRMTPNVAEVERLLLAPLIERAVFGRDAHTIHSATPALASESNSDSGVFSSPVQQQVVMARDQFEAVAINEVKPDCGAKVHFSPVPSQPLPDGTDTNKVPNRRKNFLLDAVLALGTTVGPPVAGRVWKSSVERCGEMARKLRSTFRLSKVHPKE